MFNRHCFRATVGARALTVIVTAGLLAASACSAQAQTTAELIARRDSIQQRYATAQLTLAGAQSRARAVPDDSLLLHGSIVRFNSENLDERERRMITRAFDVAAEELTTLFGPDGTSLLNGQAWLVTVMRPSTSRSGAGLVLEPVNAGGGRPTMSLGLPLNIPTAAGLVRMQAGQNLIRNHPRVRAALGGQFRISEPNEIHYFAYRQLALHASTPARRCARGNVASCTDILSFAARERWFDASDSVNGRLAPASGVVRESLLRYAVEVDGPALLRALQSPADTSSESLLFLADAVGQQPEQFLRGWQERLATSGAERVRARPSTVIAAMGWFVLFGFVAMRRRPQ